MNGYRVRRTKCACHPETCCCDEFQIIDGDDEVVASGNNAATLNDLIREVFTCHQPPPGWRCTREAGHEGPCAAVPL